MMSLSRSMVATWKLRSNSASSCGPARLEVSSLTDEGGLPDRGQLLLLGGETIDQREDAGVRHRGVGQLVHTRVSYVVAHALDELLARGEQGFRGLRERCEVVGLHHRVDQYDPGDLRVPRREVEAQRSAQGQAS